jgi:WD40 repeat protein
LHPTGAEEVTFSADGRLVVSTGGDNIIHVWNPKTGKSVAQMQGSQTSLSGTTVSPDGAVVVAGDFEVAPIWEMKTGRELGLLTGNRLAVFDIAFSPDGKKIALAGADGVARIYSCQPCGDINDLVAAARHRVTRSLTQAERERFVGS